MTIDNKPNESPSKVVPSQIPMELSVVVVEPTSETDVPCGAGPEKAVESEVGHDGRINTSLISMVTMKPPKKEASMPTVPEMSSTHVSNTSSPVVAAPGQQPRSSAVQSRFGELHGSMARSPFLQDPSSAVNATQLQSADVSPSSPFNRYESCGSPADHGISKSQVLSRKVRDRSDVKASLASQLRMAEGTGSASKASSVGKGRGAEDVRDLTHDQDQALKAAQAATQAMKASRRSREYFTDQKTSKPSSLTDTLDMPPAFPASPPQHCRSAFERGVSWTSESIRAFRRDEEEETMEMDEAEQNIDRMFNSCADLAHLWADDSGMKHDWLFASTPCFDHQALRHSRSDLSLLTLADPHPFLNLAPPVNPKGRYSGGVRMRDSLEHYHSDELPSWVEVDDDYFVVDKRKNQNADKDLKREKTPETIVKVPEPGLRKLCAGVAGGGGGVRISQAKSEPSPNRP